MITTTKNEDNSWVVEILKSDNLNLSNARNLKQYGKAELKPSIKILLWTMRLYVVLSFFLIVAQIFISLKK